MPAPLDEADARLLAAYRSTTWTVEGSPLRIRIGRPAAGPLSLPCAIVTAYNPRSELATAAENAAADRRLRLRLERAGTPFARTLARARPAAASEWDEPGYLACGVTLPDAAELARSFGQNAIVWIGSDAVPTLIATRAGFCGAEVGAPLPPS